MNTSPIKAIKLTQCTGAYWRGDANNRDAVPGVRHQLPQLLCWKST